MTEDEAEQQLWRMELYLRVIAEAALCNRSIPPRKFTELQDLLEEADPNRVRLSYDEAFPEI